MVNGVVVIGMEVKELSAERQRGNALQKINGKHEETNYDNYAFIAAYLSEKQANTGTCTKPKPENNDG